MRTAIVLLQVALCSLPAAGASTRARHYSYIGRLPLGWTSAEVQRSDAAALTAAPYTVYIGDAHEYTVARIRTDSAGNTYIAGSRAISEPAPGTVLSDVFVTKLDSAGNLVFTATIGGKGSDGATDLAIDAAGNLYVAGRTSSTNFPLRNAMTAEPSTSFIVKLSPDGSQLLYSTYFGGRYTSIGAIGVDAAQNIYVGGSTNWNGFRATPGLPADTPISSISGHVPAFAAKIAASGQSISYLALIGGNAIACQCCSSCWLSSRSSTINRLAVDGTGALYFAGGTNVTDLPVTPGAFVGQGGLGAFAGKIKADGSALAYLTYLSKNYVSFASVINESTDVAALAVDASGNAYLGGNTWAPDFPVTAGAYQTKYAGPPGPPRAEGPGSDGFVLKLNPEGTGVVWGTYLGGSGNEQVGDLSLDAAGNMWASGWTRSADFPNANGWDPAGRAFLVALNAQGSALNYSGRMAEGSTQSVAIDSSGAVHLGGISGLISSLPAGMAQPAHIAGLANAAWGGLSGRIAPGELISIYGPGIGPEQPASFQFDAAGLAPVKLGGVEVSIGGFPAPLLYVSKNQVNAVVPYEVKDNPAQVALSLNGAVVPSFAAMVDPSAPEVFRKADGSAAVLNQDGTLNSATNPAVAGSVVAIWVTGVPPFQNVDGALQKDAQNAYCCDVVVNGLKAEVLYAGAAPGMVSGVAQVNFRLPAQLNFSPIDLYVQGTSEPERRSERAMLYVIAAQ